MSAITAQQSRKAGEDVEDDFVSPLTMIRGVLEMVRDSADLPEGVARRFVDLALDDCDRLGESINRLIESNPGAVKRRAAEAAGESLSQAQVTMDDRLVLLPEDRIAEVDFSDLAFSDAETVNRVHDALDALIADTGRQWYLMVNFRNCTIDPAAWVAFAHRGKRTNKVHSLGTVRYAVPVDAKPGMKESEGVGDNAMFKSRQAAIDFLRKERAQA